MSDDAGWDSFDREWRILLAKYGIGRLHTSDFLNGHAEYKGLAVDRRLAISEFIEIIQKHVLCGISIGVDAASYRFILAGEHKKAPPEDFCFFRVVRRAAGRCVSRDWEGRGLPLSLVFDDSEAHSMRFYGAYRKLRQRSPALREAVCSISFADDRFYTPLQAADLLACATVREYRKGALAWKENSIFYGLLKKDAAYGLLYEQEYWDSNAIGQIARDIIDTGGCLS